MTATYHTTKKPQWRRAALAILLLVIGNIMPAGQQAYAQVYGNVTVTPKYISTPYDKYIPNFCGAPTITSVASGNWSNPTTWSTGKVPATGDIVSIGHNVTYDMAGTSATAINSVCIDGTLNFRPDITTVLYVTNLVVMPDGTLQVGTQAQPVAANVTAGIVFNDLPIDTGKDPAQYGHGLLAFGKVNMHGAAKTPFVRLASDIHTGDTTLTLATAVTGWNVGDSVYLPNTQQLMQGGDGTYAWSPQYEKVKIAGVSADSLTLTLVSAPQFDHPGLSYVTHNGKQPRAEVANMTRNVIVKSGNAFNVSYTLNGSPTTAAAAFAADWPGTIDPVFSSQGMVTTTRAYTMFSDRANVDIENVGFNGLGRTTEAYYNDTIFDSSGNVTHAGINQENRNPITFLHLIGPSTPQANGYQYTFANNVVQCPLDPMPFRWGINIYDSHYGLVQNNVVVNWEGAGIIAPTGSETANVIDGNYVAQMPGNGDRADSRGGGHPVPGWSPAQYDIGFEGGGIWLCNPNNAVTNNWVDSDNHSQAHGYAYYGYTYYAISSSNGVLAPPFQGADYSQYVTVFPDEIPVLAFNNNEVVNSGATGLTFWWINAGLDTPYPNAGLSTFANFTAWHQTSQIIYSYPSSNVLITGYTAANEYNNYNPNATAGSSEGYFASDYMADKFVITNADIERTTTGINASTFISGPFQINNSYIYAAYGIIDATSSAPATDRSDKLPPHELDINNTTVVVNQAYPAWMYPCAICMNFGGGNGGTVGNLIVSDKVFVTNWQGVQGDNFQVFYNEQAANYIVPLDNSPNLVGCPEANLTNAQCWAKYGIAIAGAVAP